MELVTGSKGKWWCDWGMGPEQWITGRSAADTGTPEAYINLAPSPGIPLGLNETWTSWGSFWLRKWLVGGSPRLWVQ